MAEHKSVFVTAPVRSFFVTIASTLNGSDRDTRAESHEQKSRTKRRNAGVKTATRSGING